MKKTLGYIGIALFVFLWVAPFAFGQSAAPGGASATAVTTDTTQTITGAKTFTAATTTAATFTCTGTTGCFSMPPTGTLSSYSGAYTFQSTGNGWVSNVPVWSTSTGDAFVNSGGGYIRNAKTFAGAPTAADCDAAGEVGRTAIDTTNSRFYWCEGAAGWKYAQGT